MGVRKFHFLFVVLMVAVVAATSTGCQMFGARTAAQPAGAATGGSCPSCK